MKKYSKIIAVAAAACLMVGALSGCGAKEEAEQAAEAVKEEVKDAKEEAEEKVEEAVDAGKAVIAGDTYVMGCSADFPPFESFDDDGATIVGYDVDMMNEICSRLGIELEIQDMNFDSVVTAVQTGKIDFGVSGMTITEERKENVAFSDPYFEAYQAIVVMPDSELKTYDDLVNGEYKAGVQLGTTGDIMATDVLGERVSQYEKYSDALAALLSGKVDCMVLDLNVAKAFAKANDLVLLDDPFGGEEDIEYYGIAMAKENTELLEAVNKALADMKAEGFFDELDAKYAEE
ncbi:MAG: basic amino acid ABC transporter substrate-binding protein [Firmicutes bacterium]|nr:basic amino acid ABC transporter substrate-binding protein [Bacillota bacterium]MBR2593854.1 basic amino acid ABC transporter substrate-binding protein [Bacillota bacterium]